MPNGSSAGRGTGRGRVTMESAVRQVTSLPRSTPLDALQLAVISAAEALAGAGVTFSTRDGVIWDLTDERAVVIAIQHVQFQKVQQGRHVSDEEIKHIEMLLGSIRALDRANREDARLLKGRRARGE